MRRRAWVAASVAWVLLVVPWLSGQLASALGLAGVGRRLWEFAWLQTWLGTLAAVGCRRMLRAGVGWGGPAAFVRGIVRGAARGPVLAAVQLAAGSLVLWAAGRLGLGGWAAELAWQEQQRVMRLVHQGPPELALVWAGLVVVAAPACEELFFRGFLHRALRQETGISAAGAALLSGAAFAALHGQVVHFPGLWACGVLLARWYERSGALAVPLGAHVSFNALTVALVWAGVLPAAGGV